jgi:hypothetical protein
MTVPPGVDPAVYAQAIADLRAIPTAPHETPADPRNPPTEHPDCGQQKGYQRHRRHGERACDRCLRANTVAHARLAMKPAAGTDGGR